MNDAICENSFFKDISNIKKFMMYQISVGNKLNCLISCYELKKEEIEIEIENFKNELNEKDKEVDKITYELNEKKEKEMDKITYKLNKRIDKIKTNNTFSLIIDNPINYKNYSLSKYCKFIELDLEKNDCLFIPKGWFHWIITEPRTISVNYEIYEIESKYDNILYNNSIKNIPYVLKRTNLDIKYDDIIDELIKYKYGGCIVCKDYGDHSPVIKPYSNRYNENYIDKTVKDIINDKELKDNYIYVIHQKTNNHIYNKYNKFPDIENNLKNKNNNLQKEPYLYCNNILYTANLWFNFDKKIQMGLHHDGYDGILSVLDGKKKVFLAPPIDKSKLYLTTTKSIF
jgi:hypothetical protein